MKYLKEPITNRIVIGENFGAAFDDWQELTQSEIDAYELDQVKADKLSQLKSRRDNSTIQEVRKGKTFPLKSSDMPAIIARFNRTQEGRVLTANWTDINGDRIALGVDDFRIMRNHLDAQDETLHNEYKRIKKLIEDSATIEQLNAIQFTF